jgi:hypothetical protein
MVGIEAAGRARACSSLAQANVHNLLQVTRLVALIVLVVVGLLGIMGVGMLAGAGIVPPEGPAPGWPG